MNLLRGCPPASHLTSSTHRTPSAYSMFRRHNRSYSMSLAGSMQTESVHNARVRSLAQEIRREQWRPQKDDVDRISYGGFSRVRGTGSRDIPHRLNASERPLYEGAKKKGYLAVKGTGYRRERKGSPTCNIYRQWCDANAAVTIVIEQNMYGEMDTVVVDLSTLRLPEKELEAAKSLVVRLGSSLEESVSQVLERPPEAVPFSTLPLGNGRPLSKKKRKAETERNSTDEASVIEGDDNEVDGNDGDASLGSIGNESGIDHSSSSAEGSSSYATSTSVPASGLNSDSSSSKATLTPAAFSVDLLREKVAEAASRTRELKERQGLSNQDVAVKESVAQLLQLKADLEAAQMVAEAQKRKANPPPRLSMLYSAFGDGSPASSPGQLQAAAEQGGGAVDAIRKGKVNAWDRSQKPPGLTAKEHRAQARSAIVATWQMPVVPFFFSGGRNAAKNCAAYLAEHLTLERILLEAAKAE